MRKVGIPLATGLMVILIASLAAGFNRNLASVALVRWAAAEGTSERSLPAVLRGAVDLRAAGITQLWLGHSEQAITLLDDAVRARPQDIWARYYLGHALRQDGRQDQAVAQWRLLDDRAVARALVNLAGMAEDDGPARIEYARLAIELDPALGAAYYQLGQAYAAQERWDKAAEMFSTAISEAEDSRTAANAHRALGRLFVAQGDLSSAVPAFEQAVSLLSEEESYYARLELADRYQEAGRYQDALALLETALKIDPTNDRALVRIGNIHQSQGDLELAETYYLRAIEAYTLFVRATDAEPSLQSWVALAELYESSDRPAEAEMAWKRVLEISPGYPAALQHLGETE
jgi:tetratricopeptide (TPR) repeat protein